MNKKYIFPAIALTVLGLGVLGVTNASAEDTNDPQNTIVQKIAQRFGLNQDDVQKVFDEERETHQKEMQARFEERLSALVNEGKITEEQKTLITNKHKELQEKREANRNSFKNLSREERKTQMETERSELEAWAEENGISLEYLFEGHGFMGGHRGPHGR